MSAGRTGGGLSAKAKAMLTEVVPAKPAEPVAGPKVGPTPEQMQRGDFQRESAKTARGQVNAVAYRRQPRFETMAKAAGSGITRDHLDAMRFYRDRFEASNASLTKCALDIEGRGGGLPQCLPPGVDADYLVRHIENKLGNIANTMRAIVLDDLSISDVAIARFGSRVQTWIEADGQRGRTKTGGRMAFVEKIVPKSGRHREIIRGEFMAGLERLTAAVRQFTSTARTATPAEFSGAGH